jgi:type II secretory pathway component PulJ
MPSLTIRWTGQRGWLATRSRPASGCWGEGALIEILTDTNTATKATVWLRGGQEGTTYTVTNRIVTLGGRTDDRTVSVKVEER